METEVLTQYSEKIKDKAILRQNYVGKIIDRSEFSVVKIEKGTQTAKVFLKIKTIPLKVRQAMVDIMAKIEANRENNFNVPDAMAIVYRQLGIEVGTLIEQEKTIQLHKDAVWKPDSTQI